MSNEEPSPYSSAGLILIGYKLMANYADLTPEQQEIVQSWQTLQARWCSQQAKASDLGLQVDTQYNAQIQGLGLDNATIIPKSNNLAGAQSMAYGDCVTIESHIQGIQSSYNTEFVRELWAKATGAENL